MLLSKERMQLIVDELESTIHRNINIMDTHGGIIASNDAGRIGTVHQAASLLLEKNLPRLDIAFDEEYEGARQGSNLPITFHGETVGVVGITGNPKEVGDLGAIIKKMTEILIEDAYQKEQALLFDNARSTFLYRWLLEENLDQVSLEQLELGGTILGIDIHLPRIAAVLEPCLKETMPQDVLFNLELQSGLKEAAKKVMAAVPSNLLLSMGSRLLLLCSSRHPSAVELLCRQISKLFSERFGLPLAVGIGTCATGRDEIVRSLREAERACYLSLNTRDNEIKLFMNSDFLILLHEITEKTKLQFIGKIFPACSDEDLHQWMFMLRVFFDCNGSIQKTSSQLFIHKNTIQYRLNKLKQITGYDPRVYKESFSLYAALILYESITDNN